MTEIWRPVPGYEGFEASSLGRIRRLARDAMERGPFGKMRRVVIRKARRDLHRPSGAIGVTRNREVARLMQELHKVGHHQGKDEQDLGYLGLKPTDVTHIRPVSTDDKIADAASCAEQACGVMFA